MEDIPRHETWVKVRTRKDGSILASAIPFVVTISYVLILYCYLLFSYGIEKSVML